MFRKLFILSLALFMTVTLFAQDGEKCHRYGGYARWYSMGNNPYIVDPVDILSNPAYAATYTNFLWGDVGATGVAANDGVGQFAGFNFRVNKELTVGALLTRDDFMMPSIGQLDPGNLVATLNANVPGAAIVPLNNNLELLGAYSIGNITLGLGVAYASTSNEYKPAAGSGDKNSASQFGLNAGIVAKLTSDMSFNAALSFFTVGATYEPVAPATKVDASQTFIAVDARMFYKMTSKISLVPAVSFMTASGKVEATTSTDLPSVMQLGIGVGINYKVGDLIIAGGPKLVMESTTTPAVANATPELKDSRLLFPSWNLGAEWYFTDWLIGRFGYVADTYSSTNEMAASLTTKDEQTITGHNRGDVRFGLGFRFGGFNLDATVNDDILRDGIGNLSSGKASFAHVSASYAF